MKRNLIALCLAGHIADAATTATFIHWGTGVEANPISRYVFDILGLGLGLAILGAVKTGVLIGFIQAPRIARTKQEYEAVNNLIIYLLVPLLMVSWYPAIHNLMMGV